MEYSFDTAKLFCMFVKIYLIMNLHAILQDKMLNLTEIERKAGIRKLKLHEFRNGKSQISEDESLKIKEILKELKKSIK
jgi:DNA-binding Xre family transcriptional regulator